MLEVLRIRDFRLLWSARAISLLGSWLLVVGVPAYVFRLTGSLTATGLTLAAEFLPPLVLGPIAGVLVDRWDRRQMMIAADLLRAAAVGLLLNVRTSGDIWLIYLALAIESTGTVLFRPAAQAHTPALVGTGPSLSGANALNVVTDGAVRLVGAPLGGALFAAAGFAALVWIDAATYLISAATILLTTHATATRQNPRQVRRVVDELRQGLSFIRTQRTTRALLLINTMFLGANACLTALLVPYGVTVLGGSAQIGLVMSALGVGFLLGAPLMRLLVERIPPANLLATGLTVTGTGYVLLFTATTLTTALPAAVLIGAAGSATLGATQTTLQRAVPNEVLGRISSAMFTGEAAATLTGAITGPALAQARSIHQVAYLAAAATVLTAAFALRGLTHDRTFRTASSSAR